MNEQNLPENTKKEVKETAVPVVSNDSQEINNDSPPKLKENTGSKGKTNSNEASKSDSKGDSQSSIQDNGGASLASEPFIDLLYNQIESVIGGENPNQFLCLTLPGQALTAKDFAYDYKNNAEKGPMVEAAGVAIRFRDNIHLEVFICPLSVAVYIQIQALAAIAQRLHPKTNRLFDFCMILNSCHRDSFLIFSTANIRISIEFEKQMRNKIAPNKNQSTESSENNRK